MMGRLIKYIIALFLTFGTFSAFAEYTTNACSRLEDEIKAISTLQLNVSNNSGETSAMLQEQYDNEMAKLLALEEINQLKEDFKQSTEDMVKEGGTLDQFRERLNQNIEDATKMIIAENVIDQLIKFGGVDQGFEDNDSHLENLNNFKSLIRSMCRTTTRETQVDDQRINTVKENWEVPLDNADDPYPQLLCDSYYADKNRDKKEIGGFTNNVIRKFYKAYMAGGNLEKYKKALAADMPPLQELSSTVLNGTKLKEQIEAALKLKQVIGDRTEELRKYPLDTKLEDNLEHEIISYQNDILQMLDQTTSRNTPAEEALKNLDIFSNNPENPVNYDLFANIFQNPKGMEELENKIAKNYQIALDRRKALGNLDVKPISATNKKEFFQGIFAEIEGDENFKKHFGNKSFCKPSIYSDAGFDQKKLQRCLKDLVEKDILPDMIEKAEDDIAKIHAKLDKMKNDQQYQDLEKFKNALITDWKNRKCKTDITSVLSCSMGDHDIEGLETNEFNRLLNSSGEIIAFLEKDKLGKEDLDNIAALCESKELIKNLGLISCRNAQVAKERQQRMRDSEEEEKRYYNGNIEDGLRGHYDIWGTALSLNMRSRGFNSLMSYFVNDYWAIENQNFMLYNQAKQQQYYNMWWNQYQYNIDYDDYEQYGGWGWSAPRYQLEGYNFSQ